MWCDGKVENPKYRTPKSFIAQTLTSTWTWNLPDTNEPHICMNSIFNHKELRRLFHNGNSTKLNNSMKYEIENAEFRIARFHDD